jgi:hypothetical protein
MIDGRCSTTRGATAGLRPQGTGAAAVRSQPWPLGRGPRRIATRRTWHMTLGTILLIILILILIGAVPAWPYSRGWGYYPSGILGTILIIVIILVLMGRI